MGAKGVGGRWHLPRAEQALGIEPKRVAVSTGAVGLKRDGTVDATYGMGNSAGIQSGFLGHGIYILYSLLKQNNARATVLLREMNVDIDDVIGEPENCDQFMASIDIILNLKQKTVRGGASARMALI